jgi:hypothetical protein
LGTARHLLRLRHALREFFPAALVAFDDLTGHLAVAQPLPQPANIHGPGRGYKFALGGSRPAQPFLDQSLL